MLLWSHDSVSSTFIYSIVDAMRILMEINLSNIFLEYFQANSPHEAYAKYL